MGDKLSLSAASLHLSTGWLHPRLLCPHLQPGCPGSRQGVLWDFIRAGEAMRGPQWLPQSLETEEQTCLLKGRVAPLIMNRGMVPLFPGTQSWSLSHVPLLLSSAATGQRGQVGGV